MPKCSAPDCEKKAKKWCSNCEKVAYCSVDCQTADRKRHKPDCFTDKKTTKEKRKEAAETFDLLTKKDANGVKLSDLPVEHRFMHHLPKAVGEDKVRIYCFETEDLKTEFDSDDDEIAKLFSEAMARLKNLKVKRAAEHVEAMNEQVSKWGEAMMDDMCLTARNERTFCHVAGISSTGP